MGQLWKMIQEYVSNGLNWTNSTSNSLYKLDNVSGSTHAHPSDQTTTIQQLPIDIISKILKLLTPKDAARLTCVCRWLNEIISDDNNLWEYFLWNQHRSQWLYTFFAETKLRYGFPLRTCPRQELSFKHIYGERAKTPRAIIIDCGTGYCKFGWSNDPSPSVRLTTSEEFPNNGAPVETRLHDFLMTIYKRMHVSPFAQPVIISTPIIIYGASRPIYYPEMSTILFKMGVPAVCLVDQAILAMFSAREKSGILVNIGYSQTKVFPILNGEIWYKLGLESVFVGGLHLTRYLDKQLRQTNIHISSLSTVHLLKEELCYVALDYEAELLKDTEASHRIDSSVSYTLNQERFRTGELLFQPQLAGINERGLHQAVAECINHCRELKMKSGHDWFKTIVLAGGTARLPGLAERLEKELRDILPPSVSNGIRVIPSPHSEDAAWNGAKLVSNSSTFTDSWCIKPPPKPKLERTTESTMIFVCLFMVSCFIESMKRKKLL